MDGQKGLRVLCHVLLLACCDDRCFAVVYCYLYQVDSQGLTVLHRAISEGDDALLNLLLQERCPRQFLLGENLAVQEALLFLLLGERQYTLDNFSAGKWSVIVSSVMRTLRKTPVVSWPK